MNNSNSSTDGSKLMSIKDRLSMLEKNKKAEVEVKNVSEKPADKKNVLDNTSSLSSGNTISTSNANASIKSRESLNSEISPEKGEMKVVGKLKMPDSLSQLTASSGSIKTNSEVKIMGALKMPDNLVQKQTQNTINNGKKDQVQENNHEATTVKNTPVVTNADSNSTHNTVEINQTKVDCESKLEAKVFENKPVGTLKIPDMFNNKSTKTNVINTPSQSDGNSTKDNQESKVVGAIKMPEMLGHNSNLSTSSKDNQEVKVGALKMPGMLNLNQTTLANTKVQQESKTVGALKMPGMFNQTANSNTDKPEVKVMGALKIPGTVSSPSNTNTNAGESKDVKIMGGLKIPGMFSMPSQSKPPINPPMSFNRNENSTSTSDIKQEPPKVMAGIGNRMGMMANLLEAKFKVQAKETEPEVIEEEKVSNVCLVEESHSETKEEEIIISLGSTLSRENRAKTHILNKTTDEHESQAEKVRKSKSFANKDGVHEIRHLKLTHSNSCSVNQESRYDYIYEHDEFYEIVKEKPIAKKKKKPSLKVFTDEQEEAYLELVKTYSHK